MPLSNKVVKPDPVLAKLRTLCLKLPDTSEKMSWGHPNFRVKEKTFCVYEPLKGEWFIVVWVGLEHQALFLKDSRFMLTPYIGKRGWISLRVEGKLNWTEIRHLVKNSYDFVRGTLHGFTKES